MLEKMTEKSYKLALLKIEMTSNHLWRQDDKVSYLEAAHVKIWKKFMEGNKDWRGGTDSLMFAFKRFANVNSDLLSRLKECRDSSDEDHEGDLNNNASSNRPTSPCSILQNLLFAVSSVSSLAGKHDTEPPSPPDRVAENESESDPDSDTYVDVKNENGSSDSRYQDILKHIDNAILSLTSKNGKQTVSEDNHNSISENNFEKVILENFLELKKKLEQLQAQPCWKADFKHQVEHYCTKTLGEVIDIAVTHDIPVFQYVRLMLTCLNISSTRSKYLKTLSSSSKLVAGCSERNVWECESGTKKGEQAVTELKLPKTFTVSAIVPKNAQNVFVKYSNPFDEQLVFDNIRFLSTSSPNEIKNHAKNNLFLSDVINSNKLIENYFAKYRTHVIRLGMKPPILFPLERVNCQELMYDENLPARQFWIPVVWKKDSPTESLMYRIWNEQLRLLWAIDITPEPEEQPTKNSEQTPLSPEAQDSKTAPTDKVCPEIVEKCRIWDLTPLLETDSPEPESPSTWLSKEDLHFLHNLLESDRKSGSGGLVFSPATTPQNTCGVTTEGGVKRKLEWDETDLEEEEGSEEVTPKAKAAQDLPKTEYPTNSKRPKGTRLAWNNDVHRAYGMTANLQFLGEEGDEGMDSFRKLQREFARRDPDYIRKKKKKEDFTAEYHEGKCFTVEEVESKFTTTIGSTNSGKNVTAKPNVNGQSTISESIKIVNNVKNNFDNHVKYNAAGAGAHPNAHIYNICDEELKKMLNIGTLDDKKENSAAIRRMSKLKSVNNLKSSKTDHTTVANQVRPMIPEYPSNSGAPCVVTANSCEKDQTCEVSESKVQVNEPRTSPAAANFFEQVRGISKPEHFCISHQIPESVNSVGAYKGPEQMPPQYQVTRPDIYGPAAQILDPSLISQFPRLDKKPVNQDHVSETQKAEPQVMHANDDPCGTMKSFVDTQENLEPAADHCYRLPQPHEQKHQSEAVHTIPFQENHIKPQEAGNHDVQQVNWQHTLQVFPHYGPVATNIATYNNPMCPPGNSTNTTLHWAAAPDKKVPHLILNQQPVNNTQPGVRNNTAPQHIQWAPDRMPPANVQWQQQPVPHPGNNAGHIQGNAAPNESCSTDVQFPVQPVTSQPVLSEIPATESYDVTGVMYSQPSTNNTQHHVAAPTATYNPAAFTQTNTNVPSQIPQMLQVPLIRAGAGHFSIQQQQALNRPRLHPKHGVPIFRTVPLQAYCPVYQNYAQFVQQQPANPVNVARVPVMQHLIRSQQPTCTPICLNHPLNVPTYQ